MADPSLNAINKNGHDPLQIHRDRGQTHCAINNDMLRTLFDALLRRVDLLEVRVGLFLDIRRERAIWGRGRVGSRGRGGLWRLLRRRSRGGLATRGRRGTSRCRRDGRRLRRRLGWGSWRGAVPPLVLPRVLRRLRPRRLLRSMREPTGALRSRCCGPRAGQDLGRAA